MKNPAVYICICPDGRSYVGSCKDYKNRKTYFSQRNVRFNKALAQYPIKTWKFEVVEILNADCTLQELYSREQFHIDRLQTLDIKYGFNIMKAHSLSYNAEKQKTYRERLAEKQRRQAAELERLRGLDKLTAAERKAVLIAEMAVQVGVTSEGMKKIIGVIETENKRKNIR